MHLVRNRDYADYDNRCPFVQTNAGYPGNNRYDNDNIRCDNNKCILKICQSLNLNMSLHPNHKDPIGFMLSNNFSDPCNWRTSCWVNNGLRYGFLNN